MSVVFAAGCLLWAIPVYRYGVDIDEIEHTSVGDLFCMYQQVMFERPDLSVWGET